MVTYPTLMVGVTAPPAVILPNDLVNYQAELAARASAVDGAIRVCSALPPEAIASWSTLKVSIDAYATQRWLSDFVDLGAEWTLGQSLETGLESWERTAHTTCGFVPPQPRPPPNQPNFPSPGGDITGAVKWTAAAVLAVVAVVVLGKVV